MTELFGYKVFCTCRELFHRLSFKCCYCWQCKCVECETNITIVTLLKIQETSTIFCNTDV